MTSERGPAEWDVIVVPFPYSERLAEKRRPALVVSGRRLNRDGFLWIAMITGAAKEKRAGDIVIEDLSSAGLPGASMIRVSKLATIEPGRVIRRIGILAGVERRKIIGAVLDFLAEP